MSEDLGLPDVAVVGGGPAGSTAARLLSRKGWRVVLFDRASFPRPKPCGECVNPGGVALLERLGLLERVEELAPASIRGWRLRGQRPGVCVGTFDSEVRPGIAVPRARLDHSLLQAARDEGVRVLEQRKVTAVASAERARGSIRRLPALTVRDGAGTRELSARVVIGADGLRSVTARSLEVHHRLPRRKKVSLSARVRGTGPERDRGLLWFREGGVLGLAPVHAREPLWNATVVVDSRRRGRQVARDPLQMLEAALGAAPSIWDHRPEVVEGPWASGPFDWPVRHPSGDGVLLVGDAAGYYDPLTGQGIYRALRSAELAAEAADRALGRDGGRAPPFDDYARSLRREFRMERWLQSAIEAVVSRPGLRERLLGRMRRAPCFLDSLIGVTGNAASPGSLLRPGAWAGLLGAGFSRSPTRRARRAATPPEVR